MEPAGEQTRADITASQGAAGAAGVGCLAVELQHPAASIAQKPQTDAQECCRQIAKPGSQMVGGAYQ